MSLGFAALIVVSLLMAPLFISVDQFRPQIVSTIESNIRGKVELGELKLSLFPSFKISSESLKIIPTIASGDQMEPILDTKSFSAKTSLLSVLTAPSIVVELNEPRLVVVKANSKTNLEQLMIENKNLEKEASNRQAEIEKVQKTDPKEALTALPSWIQSKVNAAFFTLNIKNATVVNKDMDTSSNTELKGVNVSFENIGLNQEMKALFSADLDFVSGDFFAKGKLNTNFVIHSSLDESKVLTLKINGRNDFSDLEIKMGNLFHKKAQIPFGSAIDGTLKISKLVNLDIQALSFEFGNLQIKGFMKALDMQGEAPQIELELKSNSLELADFKSYLPVIQQYKFSGKSDFSANVKGHPKDPRLDVRLMISGAQGSSPELATPIRDLSGAILVSGSLLNPSVDLNKFKMKIGKNSDLSLSGAIKNPKAPDLNFTIQSNQIDLDEIMGAPAVGSSASTSGAGKGSSKSQVSKGLSDVATLPLDETLDQMAPTIDEALTMSILDQLSAKVQTKLEKVKLMGATYEDAGLLMTLKNRRLQISKTSIKAYKGVVSMQGSMNLVPKDTGFDFGASVSNVALGDVVKAHAPNWVGALSGAAVGTFEISGKGFTKKLLQQNLKGKILGEVKDGKTNLAVVQVINQVLAAIPKQLSQALSSQAKDSTKDQYIEGDFESMKVESQISGRKINLSNLDIIFKSSEKKFGKFRFTSKGFVSFDQDVDMLGTAFLSPDLIKISQLKGKSGQIEIPLKFSGKMYEPKVDIAYSVKKIGETAIKGETKQVVEKLLPELEKKAPKSLKKNIKDLKKLFK